jgi:type I restriction enzyme S subunit
MTIDVQSKDWATQSLSSLGDFIRGVTYNPEKHLSDQDTSDSARLLRSNNIQDEQLNIDSIQFVDRGCVSRKQELKNGDIIFCMANGSKALVGKAAKFLPPTNHTYTFGAFMGVFRPRFPEDSDYVLFLTQSKEFRDYLDVALSGSSINNLRPSDILQMQFAIPGEDERRIIASTLRDIDNLVIELNTLIAKKRNIKQGAMQQLLTGLSRLPEFTSLWHKSELSALVNFQNGFSFSSGDYVRNGHFLMRISNVQNGAIVLTDPVFVEVSGKPRFSQFILEKDDILISLTGNVGRIGRLKASHLPAALNQRVAKISSKDREILSEDFLYHCLRSTSFLDFVINSGEGAAQQNTSVAAIGKYLISYPNILEQEAIAEIFNDFDAEIEALIAQRDKAALLKIGMMQNLLTGKVRL